MTRKFRIAAPTAQQKHNAPSPALQIQTVRARRAHLNFYLLSFIYYLKKAALRVLRRAAFSKALLNNKYDKFIFLSHHNEDMHPS